MKLVDKIDAASIDGELVKMCCLCESLQDTKTSYPIPIDDVDRLIINYIFKISHGYCKPCFEHEMAKIKK